jgi:hypothetical protein
LPRWPGESFSRDLEIAAVVRSGRRAKRAAFDAQLTQKLDFRDGLAREMALFGAKKRAGGVFAQDISMTCA